MARAFTNGFYKSKAWKNIRSLVYNEAHGICEECGEPGEEVHHIIWLNKDNINDSNITLGRDNLKLLCKKCHIAIHRKKKATKEGLRFNEHGELVPISPL